jgi:hypothetical protein
MANLITQRVLLNGSKLFTIQIDIVGDASGEETATSLIDASAILTGAPADFKIRAIQWALIGFSVELLWDGDTNTHAFSLPEGSDGLRFSDTGAHLLNNAAAGKTGDLLMTTLGLATAGSNGTIIIEGQHK